MSSNSSVVAYLQKLSALDPVTILVVLVQQLAAQRLEYLVHTASHLHKTNHARLRLTYIFDAR